LAIRTCLFQGDFSEAQTNFFEALTIYRPELDDGAVFHFGHDSSASARTHLTITRSLPGDVGPALPRREAAVAYAIETGHVLLVNT
jgi:hypothetical protein